MTKEIAINKNCHWLIRRRAAGVKSEHQQRVEAAMEISKQELHNSPQQPSVNTRLLRARLIFEECMEAIEELGIDVLANVVNSVDAPAGTEMQSRLNWHTPKTFLTDDGYTLKADWELADADADTTAEYVWKSGLGAAFKDDNGWPVDAEGERLPGKITEWDNGQTPVMFMPTDYFNLSGVADGCADIKVVTTGLLSACGIADVVLQEEVDGNNLKKFPEGFKLDAGGKYTKPPGHKPPRIREILEAQGLLDWSKE
jgi:predicted HAD superfamily Cof-like phosphohydrolase